MNATMKKESKRLIQKEPYYHWHVHAAGSRNIMRLPWGKMKERIPVLETIAPYGLRKLKIYSYYRNNHDILLVPESDEELAAKRERYKKNKAAKKKKLGDNWKKGRFFRPSSSTTSSDSSLSEGTIERAITFRRTSSGSGELWSKSNLP